MLSDPLVAAFLALAFAAFLFQRLLEWERMGGLERRIPRTLSVKVSSVGLKLVAGIMMLYPLLYLLGSYDLISGSGLVLRFPGDAIAQSVGIAVMTAGLLLSLWAIGSASGDRPGWGGPYHYLRQPICLGTCLMAVGLIATTLYAPAALVLLVIPGQVQRSRTEERVFMQQYGEVYRSKVQDLPMFLPRMKRL